MRIWQPSIAPAALRKARCLASPANPWDTTSRSSGVGRWMTLWRRATSSSATRWTIRWTVCRGIPNTLETTRYDAPHASQNRNTRVSIVAPHPCLRSWWRRSSTTASASLLMRKSGLVSSSEKNLASTGTLRLILQYSGLCWLREKRRQLVNVTLNNS